MELTHDMIPLLTPEPTLSLEIEPAWGEGDLEIEAAWRWGNARRRAPYDWAVPQHELDAALRLGQGFLRAALLNLAEEGLDAVACEAVLRLRLDRETEKYLLDEIYERTHLAMSDPTEGDVFPTIQDAENAGEAGVPKPLRAPFRAATRRLATCSPER